MSRRAGLRIYHRLPEPLQEIVESMLRGSGAQTVVRHLEGMFERIGDPTRAGARLWTLCRCYERCRQCHETWGFGTEPAGATELQARDVLFRCATCRRHQNPTGWSPGGVWFGPGKRGLHRSGPSHWQSCRLDGVEGQLARLVCCPPVDRRLNRSVARAFQRVVAARKVRPGGTFYKVVAVARSLTVAVVELAQRRWKRALAPLADESKVFYEPAWTPWHPLDVVTHRQLTESCRRAWAARDASFKAPDARAVARRARLGRNRRARNNHRGLHRRR